MNSASHIELILSRQMSSLRFNFIKKIVESIYESCRKEISMKDPSSNLPIWEITQSLFHVNMLQSLYLVPLAHDKTNYILTFAFARPFPELQNMVE